MQGKGQFRNTNIVTFAPRYEIDNQSGHKLAISQRHFTSKEVSQVNVLHAGNIFIIFLSSANKLALSVGCWKKFHNFLSSTDKLASSVACWEIFHNFLSSADFFSKLDFWENIF